MLKAKDQDEGTLVLTLTAKNKPRNFLRLTDGFQHRQFVFAAILSAVIAKSYEIHQTQKQIENGN